MKKKNDVLKMLAEQAKNRLRGEKPKRANIKIISNKDEELYEKIKEINSRSDVFNPIARLMDMTYYKTLSPEAKERYFFAVVNKYHALTERYQKELGA